MKVVKEYHLPAGNAGPYAVTVDGGGMVWVNEINTDTVVRLNPATDAMRVVQLPSKNVGRKADNGQRAHPKDRNCHARHGSLTANPQVPGSSPPSAFDPNPVLEVSPILRGI